MPALNISLPAAQLQQRMAARLAGLASPQPATVLWRNGDGSVLIYLDSLRARLIPGWLVCNLDLQSDQTGRQTLQFVFYLGQGGQGDGLHAAASVNATTPQAARLQDAWGGDVQRVLWDAVLDTLETSVAQAAARHPGVSPTLRGFQARAGDLFALVVAGDK